MKTVNERNSIGGGNKIRNRSEGENIVKWFRKW